MLSRGGALDCALNGSDVIAFSYGSLATIEIFELNRGRESANRPRSRVGDSALPAAVAVSHSVQNASTCTLPLVGHVHLFC